MEKGKKARREAEELEELQQGESKGIAKQEALKHLKKRQPQRDVPRVDGEVQELER